jgi:hypothetical protein
MKKVTKLVLMFCLVLSGAFCYANGAARTENEKRDGTPILTIAKVQHGGTDKSGSITPTLDDHVLRWYSLRISVKWLLKFPRLQVFR